MRDNIEMMLHFKRVERPAAGVYGGLCVAPYHYKHFDELLADIGARPEARRSAGGDVHAARRGCLCNIPGVSAGVPGGGMRSENPDLRLARPRV